MIDHHTHLADDILNAWIDGVATPEEHAIVTSHTATCDVCAERLDELQAVKTMFGELLDVAPPRSFALTAEQAKKPTPIGERSTASNIIRLLPIVRTLSVAAMITVLILGATLVLNPPDDTVSLDTSSEMTTGETDDAPGSLEITNQAPASQERGEVVDQGEAASAHDSTTSSLEREAQPTEIETTGTGLTGLEIATIVLGVLAILLGVSWMWMSMAIRGGTNRS